MCSYRNITAVDNMYLCVLTHATYTSSYYASIQVLGPLNIKRDHDLK